MTILMAVMLAAALRVAEPTVGELHAQPALVLERALHEPPHRALVRAHAEQLLAEPPLRVHLRRRHGAGHGDGDCGLLPVCCR